MTIPNDSHIFCNSQQTFGIAFPGTIEIDIFENRYSTVSRCSVDSILQGSVANTIYASDSSGAINDDLAVFIKCIALSNILISAWC